METSTDVKDMKRSNIVQRAWAALLCWLSYVSVDMFESHMLVVTPCCGGIFISGSALSGMSGVTVSASNFDALERQLERHKPGVPFPFRRGASWAIVPARYFRLFRRLVSEAIAAWRSIR